MLDHRSLTRAKSAGTHSFEILGVDMALIQHSTYLLPHILMVPWIKPPQSAPPNHQDPNETNSEHPRQDSLKLLPSINHVPVILVIVIFADLLLDILDLLSRDATPIITTPRPSPPLVRPDSYRGSNS
jgi:hypothetical protein